jgi:uncharacterized protein YbjQ (UPF0145 family)
MEVFGNMVEMVLVNTPTINGEVLGLVYGNVVKSRFFARDLMAQIRKMMGWEVKEYTEMLNQSKQIAIDRMKQQAEDLGADAIVNIRFASSTVDLHAAEVLVYGTAIKRK